MNAFQILDKNNLPISINTLDKEVCELVGNEVDEKYYCRLGKKLYLFFVGYSSTLTFSNEKGAVWPIV